MPFLKKLFLCNFFVFCLIWLLIAKENTNAKQYAIIAGLANLLAFFVLLFVEKWKQRKMYKK